MSADKFDEELRPENDSEPIRPEAVPTEPEASDLPDEFAGSTLFSSPKASESGPAKKKNRKLRSLIAGVTALAVLAGATVAVKLLIPAEEEEDDPSSDSAVITVVEKKTEDLKEVHVKSAISEYKVLSYVEKTRTDSSVEEEIKWYMDGYDKELMDEYSVSDVADTYAAVTAMREMSLDNRTLADFGLDKPGISVKVTDKQNESYTLLMGSESPTGDGVYLKLADSDKVYLCSLTYKTYAEKKPLDFASTEMVRAVEDTTEDTESGKTDPYFSAGTLIRYDRITMGGTLRAKEIVLEYDDEISLGFSPYKVISPRKTDADSEKITTTLLSPMGSGLYAESVYALNPTQAVLKSYGLDKPLSVITYEIKSRKVTLSFAEAPDKGYYAATVSGKPVIFKIAKSSVPFAEWQGPDLYQSLIFLADIHSVEKILVEKGGKKHVFEIDIETTVDSDDPTSSDTSVSKVRADGKEVNVDKFKQTYQVIIGLTATEYSDIEKPKADPNLTLRFVYRDKKRAESVLTFTKVSERRYWYEVEGAGNILISAEKYNNLLKTVMSYFE